MVDAENKEKKWGRDSLERRGMMTVEDGGDRRRRAITRWRLSRPKEPTWGRERLLVH